VGVGYRQGYVWIVETGEMGVNESRWDVWKRGDWRIIMADNVSRMLVVVQ
jgi:hypothetical protein